MKQGVFIINYARGQVVSNSGLVEALKSGKVAGYATDFPTKEQIAFENVYATPHLGAATFEAKENCDNMGAREAIDYLENGNTMNSVNLPNISFARGEGSRITIIHDNVPGMLGFITEKVSNNKLNIENLLNSAKGEIAYTILDFHIEVPSSIKKEIEEIPHVIKVRIL
jgi:D-3-phosphoglycerate dehydrogenase